MSMRVPPEGDGKDDMGPRPRKRTVWVWWTYLFLISLIDIGGAMAYDGVAAVAPYLRREYGVTGEKLAALYSVYHLPNVFWLLPAGIIIDYIGPALSSSILSLLVLGSTVIFSLASKYEHMLAARVILGFGNEALSVAQLALINQAFGNDNSDEALDSYKITPSKPKRWWQCTCSTPTSAVAYTVGVLFMRLGVLAVYQVLPLLIETHGWNGMWFFTLVATICFIMSISLVAIEYRWLPWRCVAELPSAMDAAIPETHGVTGESVPLIFEHPNALLLSNNTPNSGANDDSSGKNKAAQPGCCSRARRQCCAIVRLQTACLSWRVWSAPLLLSSLFLFINSASVFPLGEISTDMYATLFQLSDVRAARTSSVATLIGITTMVPVAVLLDAYQKYNITLIIGTSMLIPALALLITVAPVAPELIATLVGFGASIVSATIWPLIGLRVEPKMQGRVMAGLTAGQNLILVISPIVVGALRDHYSVGSNHFMPALIYMVCLEVLGLLIAIVLGFVDDWKPPHPPVDVLPGPASEAVISLQEDSGHEHIA